MVTQELDYEEEEAVAVHLVRLPAPSHLLEPESRPEALARKPLGFSEKHPDQLVRVSLKNITTSKM